MTTDNSTGHTTGHSTGHSIGRTVNDLDALAVREAPAPPLRNDDVDWDQWPVSDYIDENYRDLHPADAAIIDHHCAYLSQLPPDGIDCSLELGAGPNLYPLLLTAACSRRIDALDPSAASIAYLRQQLAAGPDPHWLPFYDRMRALNTALPTGPREALTRVRVVHARATSVRRQGYGLASMHFVAEGASEDRAEFEQVCRTFVDAVRPGGHLIAAFMENLGTYTIAAGRRWPGYRVDTEIVRDTFAPHTDHLQVERIEADPTLPDYGYTGMVLLTARRAGGPSTRPTGSPAG